jgi:glycosyltransferase involved in cell wall biosynthesis
MIKMFPYLRHRGAKLLRRCRSKAWSIALDIEQFPLRFQPLPRICLITSVYKASQFIDQLLDDVTSQTVFQQSCEWILLDANPSNDSYEEDAIRNYSLHYPQIHYQRLPHDPGIYALWNQAIRMSDAPFITNINCDDRRAPHALELQARLLQSRPEIDLVYNDNYWVYQPNINWKSLPWRAEKSNMAEFSRDAMMSFNLPHNNPMWRRTLHDRFGFFDTNYRSAADWEFWLRCINGGAQFMKHPKPLGIYYRNPTGMSTNADHDHWKHAEEQEIRARYS